MIRFQGDNSLIFFPGRQVTMEEVRQLKMMKPGVNDERIMLDVGKIDCDRIEIGENPFEDQLRLDGGILSVCSYAKFLDSDIIVIGDDGCLNSFATVTESGLGWHCYDAGNERGLVWSIQSAPTNFDYKRLLQRWEELGKPEEVHACDLLGEPRPKRSLRTLQPL